MAKMNGENQSYMDAVGLLLACNLSGADREFCERIERDGFADSIVTSEDDEEAAALERQRVRELCLAHGIQAPS